MLRALHRNRLHLLEFVVKVVAAFSALVPFLFTWKGVMSSLDQKPELYRIASDPRTMLGCAFGTAYAATTHTMATVVGVAIGTYVYQHVLNGQDIFSLLDQMPDAKQKPPETKKDEETMRY